MQKNLRFYREPDHLRSICSLVIFPALRIVSTNQKYFLYCTTDIVIQTIVLSQVRGTAQL